MKKYKVLATVSYDVALVISASSREDAMDKASNADPADFIEEENSAGGFTIYDALPSMRKIKRENSFAITNDYLGNLSLSAKEVSQLKSEGYKEFFRLYDDDDNLYYSGYLHESEEDDFAPLDWAMADSGCTYIKYRNKITNKFEII